MLSYSVVFFLNFNDCYQFMKIKSVYTVMIIVKKVNVKKG